MSDFDHEIFQSGEENQGDSGGREPWVLNGGIARRS